MKSLTRKYNQSNRQNTITKHVGITTLLLAGALAATPAIAMDRYVDGDTGVDAPGCLSVAAPCQTLAFTIGETVAGDTINLVSATGLPVTYLESGLTIPYDLTIVGEGAGKSIIDANTVDRVFNITGGDVLIRKVTIMNGDAGINTGGGINLQAGNLTVIGSKVVNNTALAGGGIAAHNAAGDVLVIASAVKYNNSTSTGAGIWCDGCGGVDVALSGVSDNLAGSSGGGIFIENSTANIVKSYMKRNNADTGGAMFILGGSHAVVGSELSDNEADSLNGGAVLISGTLNVHLTTMADNTSANQGGAIHATDGSIVLASNSTFSGNQAFVGGAFSLDPGFTGGPAVIVGASTLYNNESTFPGASEHIFGGWTLFEMNNTIVTNDPGALVAPDAFCNASMTAGEHNLIDDSSCDGPSLTFNLGMVNNFDLNLAFNGGITRTHELTAGSNAIDAGDNASCINPATGANLVVDQRGRTRPVDGDLNGTATCDIGAYEVQ